MSLASDSARSVDAVEGVFGPGSIIAGKYRVEQTLGKGGMGVVYAARHLQLNQLVAIKFLHVSGEPNAVGTARFMREARASAALHSEHVVRVFDVGVLESGAPYIVMEHLKGMSVSTLIRRHAPLAITQSVDLVLQACKAMSEAQALGIVHRDIKPGNLYLAERADGSMVLKVLDFGISKAPELDDPDEPTLTQSQMVLGSPKYLSPEQVRDAKNVDHRTDVWALGLVLYYMLSGRRPFEGDTMSAVCVSIATDTPPRLIDLRPDLPPELDEVVMRCLEKDRERRVQSAGDLARGIAPFASDAARAADVPAAVASAPSNLANLALPTPAELYDMDVPDAPISRPVRRVTDDSRNIALAVNAPPPALPVLWIQAGVALAVVGVALFVLLGRGPSNPADDVSGLSVSEAPSTGAATAATPTPDDDAPEERSVLIPGSSRPAPPPRPTASALDLTHLLGANALGTTQASLRLLDTVGGQRVIGVVPRGEVVMIKKVLGEWCLVTYVGNGKPTTGWTFRNLIQ